MPWIALRASAREHLTKEGSLAGNIKKKLTLKKLEVRELTHVDLEKVNGGTIIYTTVVPTNSCGNSTAANSGNSGNSGGTGVASNSGMSGGMSGGGMSGGGMSA